MNAPDERRVRVKAHDLERDAVGDGRDGAFGQEQRRVELAVAQRLRHRAGAAGIVAPRDLDAEGVESPRLERQVPRQIEVLGDASNP